MPESVYIEAQDRYVLVRTYSEHSPETQRRLKELNEQYYKHDLAMKRRVPLRRMLTLVVLGDAMPDDLEDREIHYTDLETIRKTVFGKGGSDA